MKKSFHIGGGMQIWYWLEENGLLWHMYSDLTEEEWVSLEEFTPEIFYSDAKLGLWFSKAKKIEHKKGE